MSKPEDIPQEAWLKAQIALDREPGQREEAIARAIMAEREACALLAEGFKNAGALPQRPAFHNGWVSARLQIAAAIRKRGEG